MITLVVLAVTLVLASPTFAQRIITPLWTFDTFSAANPPPETEFVFIPITDDKWYEIPGTVRQVFWPAGIAQITFFAQPEAFGERDFPMVLEARPRFAQIDPVTKQMLSFAAPTRGQNTTCGRAHTLDPCVQGTWAVKWPGGLARISLQVRLVARLGGAEQALAVPKVADVPQICGGQPGECFYGTAVSANWTAVLDPTATVRYGIIPQD